MKNKIVGILVTGIAIVMAFITYAFNKALTNIVNTSCSHGPSCPMWGEISFQTNISIALTIFVILIGLYLIFFGKEEVIITKIKKVKQEEKFSKEKYQKIMNRLTEDEKLILNTIISAEGTIFQSDLVEKTKVNKVKISRILDRLEGKNLIERKRRGMTNVVILKHQ